MTGAPRTTRAAGWQGPRSAVDEGQRLSRSGTGPLVPMRCSARRRHLRAWGTHSAVTSPLPFLCAVGSPRLLGLISEQRGERRAGAHSRPAAPAAPERNPPPAGAGGDAAPPCPAIIALGSGPYRQAACTPLASGSPNAFEQGHAFTSGCPWGPVFQATPGGKDWVAHGLQEAAGREPGSQNFVQIRGTEVAISARRSASGLGRSLLSLTTPCTRAPPSNSRNRLPANPAPATSILVSSPGWAFQVPAVGDARCIPALRAALVRRPRPSPRGCVDRLHRGRRKYSCRLRSRRAGLRTAHASSSSSGAGRGARLLLSPRGPVP